MPPGHPRRPDRGLVVWVAAATADQAGPVTTRLGFAIIGVGVALIVVRIAGWVDTESADILSVLAIVVGAIAVAIDGEPRTPKHP